MYTYNILCLETWWFLFFLAIVNIFLADLGSDQIKYP